MITLSGIFAHGLNHLIFVFFLKLSRAVFLYFTILFISSSSRMSSITDQGRNFFSIFIGHFLKFKANKLYEKKEYFQIFNYLINNFPFHNQIFEYQDCIGRLYHNHHIVENQ
jgi:hypothetical protein